MMLSESQVEKEYLESAKAFHFGTLSMTHEEVRKATQKAITIAKEAGMLISFDPNLRPPLWSSMELAKEQIAYGLGPVSYTHLRAHETDSYLVCRLLLEKKKKNNKQMCVCRDEIYKQQ